MPSAAPLLVTRPIQELFGRHLGYGFAGFGVSTAIGNYTETDIDLSFSGGLVGLLDWARTYNSRSTATGVLGAGWSTSLGAGLTLTAQSASQQATGPVQFHDADGRVLAFTPNQDGTFTRPQDLDADLTRNPDGTFTLTFNSGEVWSFDANGQLTSKTFEGQTVTLSYGTGGLLSQAAHSSGAHITFSYDANGRLTTAEANDGRTVAYAYATDGTLSSVTLPGGSAFTYASTAGMITRITNPEGNLVVASAYADGLVSHQDLPAGGAADFTYDLAAGLTTVTSRPAGAQVSFQADANGRMTRVTDPAQNAATFAYDANGRLTQAVTPGGAQLTQTYNDRGNVLTSTFEGSTTSWAYDGLGRVTSMTNPVNSVTTYAYTGDSRIPSQVTGPNGGVTRTVASGGLVTQTTDADGNTTVYGYDAAGNLGSVTDPTGEVTRFTYDAAGNRTAFIYPSGATASYEYDGAGQVITVTDPNGAVTKYQYSAGGLVTTVTDPTSAVTAYTYTAAGQPATVTDKLGRVTAYTYDQEGNLSSVTDPAGSVTKFGYDALGQLTTVTDAAGGVTQLSYDADGNQLTEQTPAGTTQVTYDARGNVTSLTDPAGGTAHYTYDAAGRITSATGPDGQQWQTAYDAAGNVVATTDPFGAQTRQAWTPAGHLTSVTDALGRQTSYARNGRGTVVSVTDPQGGVTSTVYDADGRKVSVTTPAGLITRFGYDAGGQLIAVTDPRGWITRYEYNQRGDKTAWITPGGSVTRYSYDAAHQQTQTTDPNGSVTKFAYDKGGRVNAITDPNGNVSRYTYDNAGRLISATDPLGRTTSRSYDAAGNLVTVTDAAGNEQHMTYDAGRRLVRRTAANAVDVSYTYDAAGRRATLTDATGTTHYSYDTAGRLVSVTDPDGGTTTATYSQAGQRTSLTYASGLVVSFSYDLNGRLIGLGDSRAGEAVYALDPDGRLLTEQLPGRFARRYHYHGGLARRFEVVRDDQPVAVTSFTRNPDGKILAEQDAERTREYLYDQAGQLIAVTERELGPLPAGETITELRLEYDAGGNRVRLRYGDSETRYRYDAADQLLAAETGDRHTEFRYDTSGRLVELTGEGRRRVIERDGFGQPVTVTDAAQGSAERVRTTFNGDGLIAALVLSRENERGEEQASASVRYRWGGCGQAPQILSQQAEPALDDAERDRASRLTADFAYGYGRTFASWEHGAAAFHHDAYGSALATEDTEDWVQADRYGTFGEPQGPDRPELPDHRPPELPRFGYRGELALGPLIYLRARTYDTTLGRFTADDPVSAHVGPSQVHNPYAYANNDPVNSVDPLGTLAFPFSLPGEVTGFIENVGPGERLGAKCPGGPSASTLQQINADLTGGNYAAIAGLLHIPRGLLFPKPPPPPVVTQFSATNAAECAIFGINCNQVITKAPQYQNSNTAIPLGLEFWTGLGARYQYFNQWDPFTQMLMRDPNVQETLAVIKQDLQCGGVYTGSHNYQDPKNLVQVGKDILGALTDGRIGSNPADGFLGSYTLNWAAVPTSQHSAIAYFTVQNTTDLNSVFHPEFLTHGRITNIDPVQPFLYPIGQALGPLGLPLQIFSPLPGSESTMTQTIQWQEGVSY